MKAPVTFSTAPVTFLTMPVKLQTLFSEMQKTITRGLKSGMSDLVCEGGGVGPENRISDWGRLVAGDF